MEYTIINLCPLKHENVIQLYNWDQISTILKLYNVRRKCIGQTAILKKKVIHSFLFDLFLQLSVEYKITFNFAIQALMPYMYQIKKAETKKTRNKRTYVR